MLTPQTDSVSCLALVLCRSIVVKRILCFIYVPSCFFFYHVYGENKVV